MTKKDEKDNPGDNFSEMNDDLDSLSLDEKAAFEKKAFKGGKGEKYKNNLHKKKNGDIIICTNLA